MDDAIGQRVTYLHDEVSFPDHLQELCDGEMAVTLILRSGDRVGAVLGTIEGTRLIFEGWDEGEGPNGEIDSIEIMQVAEIIVDC